ncbi:type VI secretion system baseplate subunit TssK [Thalassotalea montiporae]
MKNKIVWREGTFLYPQHFQQMESHLETSLQASTNMLVGDLAPQFGLANISFNEATLKLGQVSITNCQGQLPDSSYFELSEEIVIDIPAGTVDNVIYLVVPMYLAGRNNFNNSAQTSRFITTHKKVYDLSADDQEQIEVETATLNIGLKLSDDNLEGYIKLAVAKVLEVDENGHVILDKSFIPQCLAVGSSKYILERVKELEILANAKATQLLTRLQAAVDSQKSLALYQDQQLLDAIYRWLPWLEAVLSTPNYKLGRFFLELKQFESALNSVTLTERSPWQPLQNEQLFKQLQPVFSRLKATLSITQQSNVTEIPWDDALFASRRMMLAKLKGAALEANTRVIIAVTADHGQISKDVFRTGFKLAGNKSIVSCLKNATPGIAVNPLMYAPPELKSQALTDYFELETEDVLWQQVLEQNELLALHIDSRLFISAVKLFLIN